MKSIFIVVLVTLLSGCMIYLEYPNEEIVSGRVYLETGESIADAKITVWEGRSFISLLPISYPVAARTVSNENGMFQVAVKNSWPAKITADIECGTGSKQVTKDEIANVSITIKRMCEPPL